MNDKIICKKDKKIILETLNGFIRYSHVQVDMYYFGNEIPSVYDMGTIKTIMFYPDRSLGKIKEGVVYDVKYETRTHLLLISNMEEYIVSKSICRYEEVYINENLDFIDNL